MVARLVITLNDGSQVLGIHYHMNPADPASFLRQQQIYVQTPRGWVQVPTSQIKDMTAHASRQT